MNLWRNWNPGSGLSEIQMRLPSPRMQKFTLRRRPADIRRFYTERNPSAHLSILTSCGPQVQQRALQKPSEGDIGARPSHPGSTTLDDIRRLTFHHVLGRGSFGQVRNHVLNQNISYCF
ncbi:hypothetical protein GDO78_020647 [Eleutherodactylus coqui]|uniref:Uncharacterized protein n=1 Tax=Eleutherodactylus coqui TaxID=57060 RepID=A0A8J6B4L7_ELECQ|nr:hypothetical protein GDO78_020647 [Eleutherodactylus coqui]